MKPSEPKPLIDENGEVRELTTKDLQNFRPAHEVLPPALQKTLGMRPRGRPAGSGKTRQIALRLNEETLDRWRASGPGWQTRMANILVERAP
jgi:uncharacterized protein (DUF4415 family)